MKRRFTLLIAALALLTMIVQPGRAWGQAAVGTTMWAEDFSGYSANDVPSGTITDSHTGTTVYGDVTLTYACGGSGTKIYVDTQMGGSSQPNLLIAKSNGSFSVSGISTGGASELTVTYAKTGGGTLAISSTTTGVSLSGSDSGTTITTNGASTIDLVFTNTNGSKNLRFDDVEITVKTAGGTPAVTHTLAYSVNPTEGGTVTVGSTTLAEGATTSISATANAGYVFGSWTVEGEGSSVNAAGDTFTMGTEDATLTANFTAVTTHTVTYHANVTGIADIEVVYNEGEDVTVAANTFSNPGFAFTEWNTQVDGVGDPYMAGDVIENIQADIDLYAQWEESSETTATLNIGNYATAHSWSNGVQYLTATVDQVNFTAAGGSNTGKYYTNGNEWRYYQNESATITISVPDDYHLVSITPTYNSNNGGALLNGSATIQSGSTVAASGTSVTFSVGNSGSATNGQVRFTNIDVIYGSDGGSQTTSDLTITNASTDLTFDLYPSATAQVINYTTSSTGAITITPASPTTYFSYVHDAQNKTITVTPLAVTPSAQTVTISQAADDDYYAGTATFTVSVANSTPLANIAALTAQTTASEYTVALSNAVVTYVGGSNAYIQDASGAVMMHKSEHGLTAGDVLNGTATVAYQLYNANPQITNLTGVTPGSGTAPDPTEVAQSAWNYTFNNVLSQYFKVTGATITQSNSKYYVSLNNENIQLYKQGGSISTLDLTKTYSITGFPTLYNSTKELTIYADPEVETSPEPSVTVTPNVINAPAAGADGSLALTYENITNFIAFDFYFCDVNGEALQEDPNWIDAEITAENDTYSLDYIIYANDSEARTAYIKVYTFDDNLEEVSAIVTVNQAEYVVDYATLPFEFDGGKADIATTDGLTQENLGSDYGSSPKLKFEKGNKDNDGLYSTLVLKINERPGTLTFDIKGNSFSGTFKLQTSEDGLTYTDLEIYDALTTTLQNESFDNLGENVRYIKWIYTEKVNGNVALGNIALAAYVAPVASITVDPAAVNATAEGGNGTLDVTYNNITTVIAEVNFYESDGTTAATYDWVEAEIDDNNNVYYVIGANEGEARTAYFKVYALDNNAEYVYSNLVTINQAAYSQLATYSLVTSVDDIVSGKHYLFVGYKGEVAYAMGYDKGNNRNAVEVTVDNNTIPETVGAYEFVINNSGEDWTIYDNNVQELNTNDTYGFLYAAGGTSNNYLKTRTTNNDDKGIWAITIDDENHVASITAKSTGRNKMRFNDGNSPLFSCYSDGQKAIYLYVKDNDNNLEYYGTEITYPGTSIPDGGSITVGSGSVITVPNGFTNNSPDNILIEEGGQLIHESDVAATVQKNITAYTAKDGDGWYLIATPVETLPKSVVAGTTYDLFYYSEPDAMWYVHNGDHSFENLLRGQGYLYANAEDKTINYAGSMKATNANININLDYTSTLSDAVIGFNLVGNPFTRNLVIGDMKLGGANLTTYYVTNTDRTALQAITSDTYQIKPGEGFFVQATAASQQLSFNASSKDDIDFRYIKIVAGNENGYDNAYIQMGDCNTLRKMNIANKTEVYVMDGEDDYAAARVEELAGSMPVHFKAIADGEYTITIEAKYTDVYYMHLFDNFTGEDIDLMLEPSYTFHAAAEDAENRFLLVFDFNNHLSVNENYTNDVFAYQYGDEIIINGEGELQIFDVMGRMVLNTKVNGVQSFNVPSNGVYILRIIGNGIKTQKIVVK